MILPIHSISLGNSPFSISSPNKLQSMLRKYSWRGKGKKTSGIGKHTNKPAQQSHIGKCIDLFDHAIFLIKEPPGRSKLNFPRNRSIIEITDHGCHQFIIGRIEIIKNGFRQLIIRYPVCQKILPLLFPAKNRQ